MKNKDHYKKARNSDIIFGLVSLLIALVFTPIIFVIMGIDYGTSLSLFGGFFGMVAGFVRLTVSGIVFSILWIVTAVRTFMRIERASNYARVLSKYMYYSRIKIEQIINDTNKPLKTVSGELYTLKKRGYFRDINFDLENKEIIFDKNSISSDSGKHDKTVYRLKKALPPIAAVSAVITLLCFWHTGVFAFLSAIAALLYSLNIFPPYAYFEETEKPFNAKKPSSTGIQELDSMLDIIYENEKEIRRLYQNIESRKITEPVSELLRIIGQITDYIQKNPEKIRRLRQFSDYYLPTVADFLKTYEELEHKEDKGGNILETLAKIEAAAADLVEVFKKEYDNLYNDTILDVSAEIAVLKTIIEENKAG